MAAQVKVIGSNGQISLGKEFAGKSVLVEQIDAYSWVIKTGQFIPDNEKWLLENKAILAQVKKGIQDGASGKITKKDFSKFLKEDK
ncbi:MAG TPA: hypothetical protein VI844_01630 [Coxiellaceae bacterium]|nr:hypothetical protein [Coxiellaceae bacterium]